VSATVDAALREATAKLRYAGVDGAGDDARRLLAHVLGLSSAELLTRPERELGAESASCFARAIARRCDREPVSRIVGKREFYGRSFAISPATLDPRPDSETLIEAVLDIVRLENRLASPLRILDVGTGSGALLITLLCELPNARGVGTDISAAALEIARANAGRLGVADRGEWVVRDALDGIEGEFDILVSNPPYVRRGEIAALQPEVARYDPWASLDGGADGLDFYRRLADGIPEVVTDGWLVLEVGHDQADAVAELLLRASPRLTPQALRFRRDVAGVRRCVAARALCRHALSKLDRESPWILSPSAIGCR
jgi:release factor glutamine methyltransferase